MLNKVPTKDAAKAAWKGAVRAFACKSEIHVQEHCESCIGESEFTRKEEELTRKKKKAA